MSSNAVSKLRKRLELSQQEFATILGVSTVSVSRWEQDSTHPTGSSSALVRLLDRAAKKQPMPKLLAKLRSVPSDDEFTRLIELVHLGD